MPRSLSVALFVAMVIAPVLLGAQQAPAPPAKTVLFVCEHGTVKSLLAKVLFEEYAKEVGLDMRALSRGTRADSVVPTWMLQGLAADKITLGAWRPQTLLPADFAAASMVVSFDVPATATSAAHVPRAQWDGTPSVSKDYANGREAIKIRVHQLVDSLKRAELTPGVARFVSVNAPVVALTHARVVDGTGAPARADQTIIVTGTQITAVGPSATTTLPAGAQVIDLTGQTVLPGQVALHEHTYFGGVKRLTQMSVSGPLLYLAYGITTAMTAGSQLPYHELNMKSAVDAGVLPGPNFLITGPYLNGGPPRNAMSRNVSSGDETKRVIDYWASEGATWIKFLGAESREVLGAGIAAAHARGLKVTAHLCSVTFTEASSLGIDLLQHGFITNSEYVAGKKPDVCPVENMRAQADVDVNSAAVQSSIASIVKNGTAVVSTLGVYETFMPEHPLESRALEFLAPDTRLEVETNHADLAKSAFVVPARLLQKMMRWERDFVAAGGLLGAGCDPWGTGFLPGIGDLRNYELLIEAGFAPEMAVRIMTLNGARILGVDARVGSVAVGKRADLMVVRGDPIATPRAIYDVVTVFKSGIGFDSERLRQAAKGHVGVD